MKMTIKEVYEEFTWNAPQIKITFEEFKTLLNQYGNKDEVLIYQSEEQCDLYNYIGGELL